MSSVYLPIGFRIRRFWLRLCFSKKLVSDQDALVFSVAYLLPIVSLTLLGFLGLSQRRKWTFTHSLTQYFINRAGSRSLSSVGPTLVLEPLKRTQAAGFGIDIQNSILLSGPKDHHLAPSYYKSGHLFAVALLVEAGIIDLSAITTQKLYLSPILNPGSGTVSRQAKPATYLQRQLNLNFLLLDTWARFLMSGQDMNVLGLSYGHYSSLHALKFRESFAFIGTLMSQCQSKVSSWSILDAEPNALKDVASISPWLGQNRMESLELAQKAHWALYKKTLPLKELPANFSGQDRDATHGFKMTAERSWILLWPHEPAIGRAIGSLVDLSLKLIKSDQLMPSLNVLSYLCSSHSVEFLETALIQATLERGKPMVDKVGILLQDAFDYPIPSASKSHIQLYMTQALVALERQHLDLSLVSSKELSSSQAPLEKPKARRL